MALYTVAPTPDPAANVSVRRKSNSIGLPIPEIELPLDETEKLEGAGKGPSTGNAWPEIKSCPWAALPAAIGPAKPPCILSKNFPEEDVNWKFCRISIVRTSVPEAVPEAFPK
jgi:hypothetical protein